MSGTIVFAALILLAVYGITALIRRLASAIFMPLDRSRTALVICPQGEQAELQLRSALQVADEHGMRLIALAEPDSEVWQVCRIMAASHRRIQLCESHLNVCEWIKYDQFG